MRSIVMGCSKIMFVSLLLSWAAGTAAPAWADGDSRAATAAERDFSLRMLTAMARAVAHPLPGFERADTTELRGFESLSPGCEQSPLGVDYEVDWVNPQLEEQEQLQEAAAVERAAARLQSGDTQIRMTQLMDKQQKLAEELAAAMQAQNMARVEEIQAQMEALGKEMEKAADEQNAVLDGEMSTLAHKSRVVIDMSVNSLYASLPANRVVDWKPPFGQMGYIEHDPEGVYEDRLVVLIGPWTRSTENEQTMYQARPNSALPHTTAQTVFLAIRGDRELAMRALSAIDSKALLALIAS